MRIISLFFVTLFFLNISKGQHLDTAQNFQKALYYITYSNKVDEAIQILKKLKTEQVKTRDSIYFDLVENLAEAYTLRKEMRESKEDYEKFERETMEGELLKLAFPRYREDISLYLVKLSIQKEDYQYALIFLREFDKNIVGHYCGNGYFSEKLLYQYFKTRCFYSLNETDSLLSCVKNLLLYDSFFGNNRIDKPRLMAIRAMIIQHLKSKFSKKERDGLLKEALESIQYDNHWGAEIKILGHSFNLYDHAIGHKRHSNKELSRNSIIQLYKNLFIESIFYKELIKN